MKNCLWRLTLVVLVFGSANVLAQEKFITLTGKISDSQTQLPVPYANIQLKSRGTGTAANIEGKFIFKIPESRAADTLLISSIGYKTVEKPLGSLGLNVSIALESAAVQLAEITVNAQTGLDILKKAIAKIPENYDTSAVQLTAFYRENLWLGDFELAFNEAVLDIYKIYKTDKKLNDQIRIIKGRKKQIDFGNDGQFYFWMSGISNGARSALGEDLVKYHNAKIIPLNPGNFRFYDYEYTELIREGNNNLIVINITPKERSRKGYIKMKVFLDEESLAFARFDLELTRAGVRYVSRKDNGLAGVIMSGIVKATREYHKFEYSILYKPHAGKWYLNRVNRHWEILVNSKKRNMVDRVWHADLDFIVTDINTENVKPIVENNIGDKTSSFTGLIKNDNDAAFWENYNILKPVADSLKTIKSPDTEKDSVAIHTTFVPNRQNGFTRADTLRGKLTPLRTCYDVTFYHLDVAVNMDQRSVKGNNLIRFKVEQPFRKMQIDLYENMKIDRILYKDKPLKFTREYNAVFIDFPEELKKGTQAEIKLYYEGIPKTPDFSIPMNGGVLWDKDSLGNPWAQMVCQGSGASLWWPNKDHQSDEPDSMKIWITVPSQFTEISNGRLIRKTPQPGDQTRYEWSVSYPINNYNATFSIGKYAHFTDRFISNDTLTIDYYVMPYNLERSKKMFAQVKPMLEAFEKNFGKYPFRRDGFTLMESLYPMEHQSGVCIGRITQENSGDTNPLMWHEAAHEWWGNAITCKDIADMWIHEAFATYAEIQVIEYRFGKEAASAAIQDQYGAVIGKEPVIGVYDVNHIYYDIGDMYSKGSLMLHTFRNVLNNDTLWVNLLHGIQKHFRYKTLSSDELVKYINMRTKTDYTYLFDQYLKYTNLPELELELEEKGTDLIMKYKWNADVKNFRMPVRTTLSVDHFDFIYPTVEWKTMNLKNMSIDEFEVDEDNFYIEVDSN